MGEFTDNNHKSMVEISSETPLIYHQIKTLKGIGIKKVLMTTGYMAEEIKHYINAQFKDLHITYVHNLKYLNTNYIYSMYLVSNQLNDDIILFHGDLYFDEKILSDVINSKDSCVVVDSTLSLPKKDFKAEIQKNRIKKIATYINDSNCVACQPLYKLSGSEWNIWMESIRTFCDNGKTDVYAEEALNKVLNKIFLRPLDIKGRLCMEVDTMDDLMLLRKKIAAQGI